MAFSILYVVKNGDSTMPNKIGKDGIALIKKFEGVRLQGYLCPAGIATIGWGHTGMVLGKPITTSMKISLDQAEKLLLSDLDKFEKGVSSLIKVTITQKQFDALVSFAYNVGLGNLGKSTLLKLINKRDPKASEQFLVWNKAGGKVLNGLTKRRLAEKELFDSK